MADVKLSLDDDVKRGLADPFYSESNLAQLERAERQYQNGQTVSKTMEELRAMETQS